MKSPYIAFILNFIFPGAGFWYLRRWSAGWLNLFIVLLVGFAGIFILDLRGLYESHRLPINVVGGTICGVVAFAAARRSDVHKQQLAA